MCHQDFHLGNVIFDEFYVLKVIDFETLTDYKYEDLIPEVVKKSSLEEKYRMGWSVTFHPGSDLNQILGELLERYEQNIPSVIYNAIKPRIIQYDKEFPYAISESNEQTTGKIILKVLSKIYSELDQESTKRKRASK